MTRLKGRVYNGSPTHDQIFPEWTDMTILEALGVLRLARAQR